MTLTFLYQFLLWCSLINYAVLTMWFFVFMVARERIYRLHSIWFRLSPSQFDAIHYAGMSFYKLSVLLFNIAPCLAIRLSCFAGAN